MFVLEKRANCTSGNKLCAQNQDQAQHNFAANPPQSPTQSVNTGTSLFLISLKVTMYINKNLNSYIYFALKFECFNKS